jgi:hypothetical protein
MGRQLLGRYVGHGWTFDEVLRLLRQQTGLGPQGCASDGSAGPQQLSSFHGDPSIGAALGSAKGAARAHQTA